MYNSDVICLVLQAYYTNVQKTFLEKIKRNIPLCLFVVNKDVTFMII